MPVYPAVVIKCDHPDCTSFCITAEVSNPHGYAVSRRPCFDPDPVAVHGWELVWEGSLVGEYACRCPHHRTVNPEFRVEGNNVVIRTGTPRVPGGL